MSFWSQLVFGLLVAVAAALLHPVVEAAFGHDLALRALLAGTGLALIIRQLAVSRARVGRLVTLVLWIVASGGLAALDAGPMAWLIVQATALWLVRSLYHHDGLLAALLDAVLLVCAFSAAAAVAAHTNSLFLSLWTLLLFQALHVFLPAHWPRRNAPVGTAGEPAYQPDPFETAFAAAESAARRLSISR